CYGDPKWCTRSGHLWRPARRRRSPLRRDPRRGRHPVEAGAPMTPRTVSRFWAKVRRDPEGCWEWTARGEKSNLAKLREQDVVAIRRLHAAGRHRNADLSAMFGVAERSIY